MSFPGDPAVGDVWVNTQGGGAIVDRVRFIPGVGTEIAFVKISRKGVLRGGGIYGFNAFCERYRYSHRADAELIARWERVMGRAWPGEEVPRG